MPNFAYANKIKECNKRVYGSRDFWRIAISVLKCYTSPINGPEVFSASDMAKLQKTILRTLGDSVISLPAFPFRINLKLHNIHVTPKIVLEGLNQP